MAENQNLADADEYKALMDSLEEDDELDDALPDDDDKQSKIGHAFAQKKRANKEAAALIKKQQDELSEYKKKDAEAQKSLETVPKVDTAAVDRASQIKNILNGLTVRAMQGLGIFQITTPEQQEMVRMERDRLYLQQANAFEAQEKAKQTAPQIIEDALSEYSQLNEDDVKVLRGRLNKQEILQRTDLGVIRREVALYLGEQSLSVVNKDELEEEEIEENNQLSAAQKAEGATSSVAAASAVKTGQVHKGVKPGKKNAKPGPAPAKPDELATMRKLGMTDLNAFREAQALKGKYKSQ